MRNILDKIKRWFRNIPKSEIKYPIIVGIVVGVISPLILYLCKSAKQVVDDGKSKFDVSAEMLTPMPFHMHDRNGNSVFMENKNGDDIKNVAVDSLWDMYSAGLVNDEIVPIYAAGAEELEYAPTVRLSVTNRNDFTINIKEITVKVLDYKSLDEVTIESQAGGADERPVQQWRCDISNAEQEYSAIYIGTVNADNSDVDKNYVCVEPGDTGEFNVVICSDTSGLYSIEVNIKYNFKKKIKTETTDEMKFILDLDKKL